MYHCCLLEGGSAEKSGDTFGPMCVLQVRPTKCLKFEGTLLLKLPTTLSESR